MNQRIVLVTGATGGLGRAVFRRFEEAGDLVAPVSRSAGEFAADLTDAGQTAAVVDRILSRFGRIDAAILTAGAFASGGAVEETTQDIWNRMLRLNFFSALYVCSTVLPTMKRAGRGRIVAVGSRAGVQLAAGLSAYGVSKSALHALIETLGLELKDSGVTANAVLPSTIDTEANRSWGSAEQAAKWVSPESIAEVIWWLASDSAADVNGALVPVYGRA